MFYAKKALAAARITGLPESLLRAYQSLSNANQLNNYTDSAYKYEHLAYLLDDSLKNARITSLLNTKNFLLMNSFV